MTKKAKLIHFGIDHLRLNFPVKEYPEFFDEYFEGLSANSNFKGVIWKDMLLIGIFSSIKQKHIINFTYNEIPVLCLEKIIDPGIGRHYSYILKFHSSFFHYPELRNILTEFIQNKDKYEINITRLDICLDIRTVREKINRV